MKVLLYTVFKELATADFVVRALCTIEIPRSREQNRQWPFENELAGSRTREASN